MTIRSRGTRRLVAAALLGTALALVAAPVLAQTAPPKPATLTMNVYAGPFERNMAEFVVKAFEADTGIKVELVAGSPPLAKLQAQGDNPEVDILIGGSVEREIATAQGLVVDFDAANIPELADVYDIAKFPNAVVVNFSALGLAYDTTQWSSPPTSWFDLVSPNTPGTIVVRQPDAQNTVAWMAILAKELNGAWPTKIEDYAEVGKLLRDNLKPRIAAITTNTATTRAGFSDAKAALGVWTDTQVSNFVAESGLPLAFVSPKEGSTMISTTAMITKTPDKYWAEKLVGYILRPEAQKGFAENGFYAPSNATVVLDDSLKGKVTFGKEAIANLIEIPWELITPINQELAELFYGAMQ
jgi:putative spermidine/putrescine transport system substrate-binding protein